MFRFDYQLLKQFVPGKIIFSIGCSVAITIFFSSCISLRHNYLGLHHKKNQTNQLGIGYLSYYENQRKQLDYRADSLIKAIKSKRIKREHIGAIDLKHLYVNFSAQLDVDKYFNILLRKGPRRHDSLSVVQRYAGVKLLMSSAWYNQFYGNDRVIRRALNRGDKSNSIPRNTLRKSSYFLNSPAIRRNLAAGKRNDTFPTDSILRLLPKTNFVKAFYNRIYQKNDRINAIAKGSFQFLGRCFFAGQSANSQLTINRQNALMLLSELQSGDIVLEKSNSYMTNQVIPGYFTHSSIWLGIKNRRKYQFNPDKLLKGRQINIHDRAMAEAITSGVRLSSLKEYTLGKIYLIIRFDPLDENQRKAILDASLQQMKKSYDFNFDIESSDWVNCTELIYLAYDFIDWETHYYMGRYTIFPDDILRTALNDKRFKIVVLSENDTVLKNPDPLYLRSLIEE